MVTSYQPYRGDVAAAPGPTAPEPPRPNPDCIPGTPSIRIVWEALAVERYRSENSKFRRVDGSRDPALERIVGSPEWQVILLNTSFTATAEQERENKGVPPSGRIARATDQHMLDMMTAFDRMGFFKYAQPTASVRPLFASENTRGRITVDRGGESWTLLSQRGLGLSDDTKQIPGIYAEAKEAVYRLKNMSPVLRVKGTSVEPTDLRRAKPTPPSAGPTK